MSMNQKMEVTLKHHGQVCGAFFKIRKLIFEIILKKGRKTHNGLNQWAVLRQTNFTKCSAGTQRSNKAKESSKILAVVIMSPTIITPIEATSMLRGERHDVVEAEPAAAMDVPGLHQHEVLAGRTQRMKLPAGGGVNNY